MSKGGTRAGPAIRVGLVGANWGETHVAAWQSIPGVELAAICTSREQTARAAAARHNIAKAYWDADRMIAEADIDIVDVTPRPSVRAPIAQRALEAGKHVIQPMPFALTLTQGERLLRTARERKLVAVVENLHRHSPAFRQARALIEAGEIGRVLSFKAFVRTPILLAPDAEFPYLWLADPANGASALRNFGAQLLHVLDWFFGPAAAVAARIDTHLPTIRPRGGEPLVNGTADSAALLLETETGVEGILDVSWCTAGENAMAFEVAGDRGRLHIAAEGLGPRAAILSATSAADRPLQRMTIEPGFRAGSTVDSQDDTLESLAFMCAAMAEAVRRTDPTAASPGFDEALRVMQVVEAAYLAHAQRSWVRVADFREVRSETKEVARAETRSAPANS